MSNGGFRGFKNKPNSVSAVGSFSANEQFEEKSNSTWPVTSPDIVTSGLVFHIDAGNTSSYPGSGSTWTDLTTTPATGTFTNGPTFDSSDGGGSVVFDGTNDYIDFGTVTKLRITNSAFSHQMWIKLDSTKVSQNGLYQHANVGSYTLYTGTPTSGKFEYARAGQANDTANVINPPITEFLDKWGLITAISYYSSGYKGVKYYINDTYIGSSYLITSNFTYSGAWRIGAVTTDSFYLKGKVAKVLGYNKELTYAEILQNYYFDRRRFDL